jgi:hypothetical protein
LTHQLFVPPCITPFHWKFQSVSLQLQAVGFKRSASLKLSASICIIVNFEHANIFDVFELSLDLVVPRT